MKQLDTRRKDLFAFSRWAARRRRGVTLCAFGLPLEKPPHVLHLARVPIHDTSSVVIDEEAAVNKMI